MSDSKSELVPAFQAYQQAFTAYIRNPAHQPAPVGANKHRMRIYAEIVLNNLDAAISACYPVCKLVVGKRAWRKLITVFLREFSATTPIFREIPEQFLTFLQGYQDTATDNNIVIPAFLPALAHYEWVELKVSMHPASIQLSRAQSNALLKAKPIVNPTLLNLTYAYPVHTISKKRQPKQKTAEPVHLLVYRTTTHEVKFIEANMMTASLIDLLQQGVYTGKQALDILAEAYPQELAASLCTYGEQLLIQLQQQEVILGVNTE